MTSDDSLDVNVEDNYIDLMRALNIFVQSAYTKLSLNMNHYYASCFIRLFFHLYPIDAIISICRIKPALDFALI